MKQPVFTLLLGTAIGFCGHMLYTELYPQHTLLFYEGYVVGIDACRVIENPPINQPRPLAHSLGKPLL